MHFAFELTDPAAIPTGPRDVVHYNLLHDFISHRNEPLSLTGTILSALVQAADEVVVLTSPRPVLRARSATRTKAEPDHEVHAERVYDGKAWDKALASRNLAQIYELLALLLEESGTPHRFLCTNVEAHGDPTPLARWEFPGMALEDAETRCRDGHADPDRGKQGTTYQTDHRIGPVSATLGRALTMRLAGKKVLDIGCAEGAVALSAARMGARVTGIEPRASRLSKARRTAEEQGAEIDFRHMMLDDLRAGPGSFDVVLALNVVHHVPNPFAFLDRAADLTRSHLVLEYPGLADTKFGSTLTSTDGLSDEQPLIGVSTRAQDQTFVFTPSALERYFLDTVRVFEHHEVVRSPMPNRYLSVFSGKSASAKSSGPTVAQLEAQLARRDREVERLRRRLSDMEDSRSWRVTEPLRRMSGRIRSH